MYTLSSENENITFHTFIVHSLNIRCCIKYGVKHEVHRRKLIVTKYVQNIRHWHEHKHASAFAIGQLRHQSAAAPSHATHAVDAVTAHQCHELWSHTHAAEWQTIALDMWPQNLPDLNPVDYAIWSVIQLDAVCNIQRVHYKGMKFDSVSTLFRWGGHFCRVCVKRFFLLKTVQKL